MNCKQVNKLSLVYCDNDLHTPTRLELEKHLKECPDCQKLIDFTSRETEALRYDGDIPDLRPNFSHEIIQGISKKYSSKKNKGLSWANRKRLQNIMTGNIVAGSLAAVLLLSWLLVPGVRESLMTTVNSGSASRNGTKVAAIKPDEKVAALKSPATVNNAAPVTLSLPTGMKWAPPDYNATSPRKATGRCSAAVKEVSPSSNSVTKTVPIFQPLYLPEGYRLTKIVPDSEGNCTLAYENGQGGLISLRIFQVGNEVVEQMDAVGSSDSSALNSVSKNSQQAGQELMLKMSNTAPGTAAQDGSEAAKTETTPTTGGTQEQVQSKAAASNANNGPAAIIWTMQYAGSYYGLELSGALPPEELGKVAASVKPGE